MIEQRSSGIVVLTNTGREAALKGAQSLAKIQDQGRLEALTVALELTTKDAINDGVSIYEWRAALAQRRSVAPTDEGVVKDILKSRAALGRFGLDVINNSEDPGNRRAGGTYRFAEDTIRKFLQAGVNLPTDNQVAPKTKEADSPVAAPYVIQAILDKMPDEHGGTAQLAPQADSAPKRRKGIRKETPEERRARELEERRLAIKAFEASVGNLEEDEPNIEKQPLPKEKAERNQIHAATDRALTSNQQQLAQRTHTEHRIPHRRKNKAEVRVGLASGFKESISTGKTITLTRKELPWLRKAEEIRLALVTLSDTVEKKFYFGSAIKEKLIAPAEALTADQNRHADTLLYTYLPDFVRRKLDLVSRLSNPVTNYPIYYLGNTQGLRVYFVESGKIEGLPVILRIAVCDKAEQDEVLSVLTKSSRSFNKSRSGL